MRHTYVTDEDKALMVKLAIAKAQLAKIEESIPETTPQYTRYADLPAPDPAARERFYIRLNDLVNRLKAEGEQEKHDWYMSMADFAP